MTDYQPGTVAVATVRGVEGVRVVRGPNGWFDLGEGRIPTLHHPEARSVTDIRPLVVLDLEQIPSASGWTYVVEGLRCDAKGYDRTLNSLADQIEAQTKPPRIPEPGLWGVVEASCVHDDVNRGQWVNTPYGWVRLCKVANKTQNPDGWSDLIDPVLIRDGVQS